MNRHFQIPIQGRARAILVALVVIVLPVAAVAQSGRQAIGTVEFVDGDVSINGVIADFGQIVEFGDWVETGPDSTIDIVFDRANIFRLGQNTVAKIEIGTTRQSVDLKFGSFSAVFDRIRPLTGGGTFEVRTPTVAGGVRGTTFYIRVLDRSTTYVCSCNGTLDLASSGALEGFLNTGLEHSARYFRQSDDSVVVEVAPLIFHSTESLNEVADQIGVTIPWCSLPE